MDIEIDRTRFVVIAKPSEPMVNDFRSQSKSDHFSRRVFEWHAPDFLLSRVYVVGRDSSIIPVIANAEAPDWPLARVQIVLICCGNVQLTLHQLGLAGCQRLYLPARPKCETTLISI